MLNGPVKYVMAFHNQYAKRRFMVWVPGSCLTFRQWPPASAGFFVRCRHAPWRVVRDALQPRQPAARDVQAVPEGRRRASGRADRLSHRPQGFGGPAAPMPVSTKRDGPTTVYIQQKEGRGVPRIGHTCNASVSFSCGIDSGGRLVPGVRGQLTEWRSCRCCGVKLACRQAYPTCAGGGTAGRFGMVYRKAAGGTHPKTPATSRTVNCGALRHWLHRPGVTNGCRTEQGICRTGRSKLTLNGLALRRWNEALAEISHCRRRVG